MASNAREGSGMNNVGIIIVGPPRSGTSALTRVVNLLGADLGPPADLAPANESNVKGYWEHLGIIQIHEEFLRSLDNGGDRTEPLPGGWWTMFETCCALGTLAHMLEITFEDSPLWAVKDPRVCRLLKVWRAALECLDVTPRFVLIDRPVREVVGSLGKWGWSEEKAATLYRQYREAALDDTEDCLRSMITFDELMADWRTTMERVAVELQLTWPFSYEEAGAEIQEFLDPGLKHFNEEKGVILTAELSQKWGEG